MSSLKMFHFYMSAYNQRVHRKKRFNFLERLQGLVHKTLKK